MVNNEVLVCVPATELDCMSRGSVLGHHCSRCGCEVMMALAGQRALREAGPAIVCLECFLKMPGPMDIEPAPGALEEFAAEMHERQRRSRTDGNDRAMPLPCPPLHSGRSR